MFQAHQLLFRLGTLCPRFLYINSFFPHKWLLTCLTKDNAASQPSFVYDNKETVEKWIKVLEKAYVAIKISGTRHNKSWTKSRKHNLEPASMRDWVNPSLNIYRFAIITYCWTLPIDKIPPLQQEGPSPNWLAQSVHPYTLVQHWKYAN